MSMTMDEDLDVSHYLKSGGKLNAKGSRLLLILSDGMAHEMKKLAPMLFNAKGQNATRQLSSLKTLVNRQLRPDLEIICGYARRRRHYRLMRRINRGE